MRLLYGSPLVETTSRRETLDINWGDDGDAHEIAMFPHGEHHDKTWHIDGYSWIWEYQIFRQTQHV